MYLQEKKNSTHSLTWGWPTPACPTSLFATNQRSFSCYCGLVPMWLHRGSDQILVLVVHDLWIIFFISELKFSCFIFVYYFIYRL